MSLIIGVLLTLAMFQFIQAHKTCCFPTYVGGQRYIVEEKRNQYYTTDFINQRHFETFDEYGDVFDIYDFANGRHYHFNDGTCTFKTITITNRFSQCITDENDTEMPLDIVGANTRKTVYAKKVTFGDHENIFILDAGPSTCAPILVQAQHATGHKTMIYSHILPKVVYPKLYTTFDNCVQDQAS